MNKYEELVRKEARGEKLTKAQKSAMKKHETTWLRAVAGIDGTEKEILRKRDKLQQHHEAAERKRGAALQRILGPSGTAGAVKIAKASGAPFSADDVRIFQDAGWTVTGTGSVAARPGTSGIAGVQFQESDWTFKNPEPLGPNGTARALVLVGRIDAATVDELASYGYDVTAAPKKLREAITRNPAKKTGFKRYRVKGTAEEFECPNCGEIVWSGEGAWESKEHGQVACSQSCLADLTRDRGESAYRYANPAPAPIQKKVFETLKASAKKRQALRVDEVAERIKQPLATVADALQRLLSIGLVHEAGRDLFGPCYFPGAPQRGLFENPSAEARATKKARAWFQDESLVTNPQEIDWTPPDAAVHIGQFIAVEYLSDKFDGVKRIYRHEVTKVRQMLLSPDGSTIIVDPPFKITKRGIEG